MITRGLPAVAALALGLSLTSPAAAQDETLIGEPVEEDVLRYPPSKVRTGLILGGGALFGVSYGLSAMSAALWTEVPGNEWLYVPIIGPWGALALNDCSSDDIDGTTGQVTNDCDPILAFRYIMYILDGMIQLGGAGIIGEGIFMTTEADAPAEKTTGVHIEVAPVVTSHYAGFGVVGTF